ncbi:hypothetical protein A2U01_0060058, partial [Trifolium medium]|nr:hypothetical protein [Trifolium medium]
FQTQDTDKSSPEKEAKEDKEEEKGPQQVSSPRVEVDNSKPLKEAQVIETLPAQESKGEHTLPIPTAVLASEQEIVQEPPTIEFGPQVKDTQPSELTNQGVAGIQPHPEIIQIEVETDTTPHLEV